MKKIEKKERGRDTLMQMVSFTIGGDEFGVDILRVQEINRVPVLTRMPQAPDYVAGVITLWGKVVPIVNLRRRFGLPPKAWDEDTRIIVVELARKQIGFIVDALQEIVRIPATLTEPPPSAFRGARGEYVTSVARLQDRLLNLVDLEKVFGREEGLLNKE
jgi:purine-binding chemotaxis protein CheW